MKKCYYCKTKEEAKKLLEYLHEKGYKWRSGESLKFFEGGSRYYYFEYYESKVVTWATSNKDNLKLYPLPFLSQIKPEYEKDFKIHFRLNKIPQSLTKDQIDNMKKSNVYEKWIDT